MPLLKNNYSPCKVTGPATNGDKSIGHPSVRLSEKEYSYPQKCMTMMLTRHKTLEIIATVSGMVFVFFFLCCKVPCIQQNFFLQLRLATSWCLHMSIVMFASLFRFASTVWHNQHLKEQPCTSPIFQCLSNEPLILFQFMPHALFQPSHILWAGVRASGISGIPCANQGRGTTFLCLANMLCPN